MKKYLLILLIPILIYIGLFIAENKNIDVDRNSPLTLQKYAYPKVGMEYSKIAEKFGEGVKILESKGGNSITEIFIWKNNEGGKMELVFVDGRLKSKIQEGLK